MAANVDGATSFPQDHQCAQEYQNKNNSLGDGIPKAIGSGDVLLGCQKEPFGIELAENDQTMIEDPQYGNPAIETNETGMESGSKPDFLRLSAVVPAGGLRDHEIVPNASSSGGRQHPQDNGILIEGGNFPEHNMEEAPRHQESICF